MVGQGIGKSRLGHIAAYQEEKRKLADLANVQNPAPEKLARPDAVKPVQEASPTVMPQADVNNPALDKMTWKNTGIVPMAGQGEYRTEALRDMNEEQFKANQGRMNASEYEYWTEQLKANPGSEYAIVNQMLASKETPEEKAKRERREQLGEVFNNLGNLIGNAANLYYTHRGGQYIDLNTANEKHRERMQRIKDKQDALDRQREQIILNAKLGDAKSQRAEAVAAKKADADAKAKDLQYKRDLILKQIDNAYKLGQIDAQTAANMKRDAAKAKSDMELETFKQTNRLIYKQTPSYEDLNGDKKKSTYTYGGTEYNKKDLSSMVNLYNKLKEDGYALPNIKGKHLNQYVDAIANLMGKGTWNMGEFAPAEQNVPDIVDSDIVSSNVGAEKWKPDYDEEWTSK